MTPNPLSPTVEKVGKEGKCPVCHIKCLVYKGVRSLEPGYYCHRCNRSFTPEGIFRPNYFWQTFNQKKVYVIPPPKRYSQEEVDKLIAHSVQEGRAEERATLRKQISEMKKEHHRAGIFNREKPDYDCYIFSEGWCSCGAEKVNETLDRILSLLGECRCGLLKTTPATLHILPKQEPEKCRCGCSCATDGYEYCRLCGKPTSQFIPRDESYERVAGKTLGQLADELSPSLDHKDEPPQEWEEIEKLVFLEKKEV